MSLTRRTLFAFVALAALVALGSCNTRALSLVSSQEQSYFFGTKAADNLLCYTKTLAKATSLPATVTYTNENMKKINFVTMNADKYSTFGYTVDLTSGGLGTSSVGYKLNGPTLLTYSIVINMYCDP